MNDIENLYSLWCEKATEPEVAAELKSVEGNHDEILDRFWQNLAFGTGGLRGVLGAGTNRMNVYTVGQATQGLANYLNEDFDAPSVAIGYDSRINSDKFARYAATVLAANGIKVYLYQELKPTPIVAYAVRRLGCSSGIVITASHNPSKYNGYKCYDERGYQMTDEAAAKTLGFINACDIFADVKTVDFDAALAEGTIEYIPEDFLDDYYEKVLSRMVNPGVCAEAGLSVIYTPLNGTGNKPVRKILAMAGVKDVTVVPAQELPDGKFPTCPFPNPEIREAFNEALKLAETNKADLLLATDPDCDRCGIAVRAPDGSYQLLSGNEVGLLLLDYICAQRTKHGKMPAHPTFVKTIVTMDLAEKIADHYGVKTVNVLTGFKFIGEVIGRMEDERDYICGFEESYGYLTGSYVRDKDGVNAAFMIAEMFAFYKTRGVSLLEKLSELYAQYGYCLNTLHSHTFPGSAGMQKMGEIMADFRRGLESVGGVKVTRTEDYSVGLNGLPKSDVLKFYLDTGSVVVRPSGTEPKLKTYISVTAENRAQAEEIEKRIAADLERRF